MLRSPSCSSRMPLWPIRPSILPRAENQPKARARKYPQLKNRSCHFAAGDWLHVARNRKWRTPASGFISAILTLLVTLFFSDTLRNLPQPVLAASVLIAVTGLFKLAELRRLWNYHRGEFLVAIIALLGVLWAGCNRQPSGKTAGFPILPSTSI